MTFDLEFDNNNSVPGNKFFLTKSEENSAFKNNGTFQTFGRKLQMKTFNENISFKHSD